MAIDSVSSEADSGLSCRNCGAPVGTDASFCPECGTEIDEPYAGPTGRWHYGLLGGIGLIVFAFLLGGAVPDDSSVESIGVMIVLVGFAMMIASMYVDTKRVASTTSWSPRRAFWIGGMVIPYLNFFVAAAYLYRRRGYTTTSSEAANSRSSPPQESQSEPVSTQPESPSPEEPADEMEPAPDSSQSPSDESSAPTPTVTVSPEQIYTDSSGARYVETSIGADKRLHTDADDNPYYERGTAMRALYGAIAVVCVFGAIFFIFLFPDAPGGPASQRGVFFFAIIDAIPLGNVIVGLLALAFAYIVASTAFSGREYVSIQESAQGE